MKFFSHRAFALISGSVLASVAIVVLVLALLLLLDGLTTGRRVARRGDRPHLGDRGDRAPLHRQARLRRPAAQVQDRHLRPAGRRARDQRHRVHRRQPSRARARPGPVGRRRSVHQPDAGPAGRRLGSAGRGARGVGGGDLDIPRLRLPAAAGQGAAEVPDQGLGHRKVPRSSRNRVPQASADRRPGPRAGQASDRSRRSATAQERAQRRRGRSDRRPGLRHHPLGGGRPGRAGRFGPDPVHPLPEAGHPRHPRRQARRSDRRRGGAGSAVAARRIGAEI